MTQIAQITNPVLSQPGGTTGIEFVKKFLPNAINLAFVVAAVVFLFMLLTGAIQWISSGGDKQGLEGAKSKISNAIIGVVVLFAVYALVNLISYFFFGENFSIVNPSITPLTQ